MAEWLILYFGGKYLEFFSRVQGAFIFLVMATVLLFVYFMLYQLGFIQEFHRRVVIFLLILTLVIQLCVMNHSKVWIKDITLTRDVLLSLEKESIIYYGERLIYGVYIVEQNGR